EDICYATTNRQEVVKKVAPMVEAMVVVGSPNSSNTQRLKEVAERAGCPRAALVQRAKEIDWSVFGSIASLGVTAGASAPEVLVEEVIGAFAERYAVSVETITTADEDMFFPLPRVFEEPRRRNEFARGRAGLGISRHTSAIVNHGSACSERALTADLPSPASRDTHEG